MKKNFLISIWVLVAVVVIGSVVYFFPQFFKTTTLCSGTSCKIESKTENVFYVTIANKPELGNYLVAPNGMTLYHFTKDEQNKSNCYDACAKNWPAFSVLKTLEPGQGVADKFDTIDRTDGLKQITYKGMPLYFWSKDTKAGDTTGQNFNNLWFVVNP